MAPSEHIKRIQNASRDLVNEPEAKLKSLNEFTKSVEPEGKPWRIVIESRGLSIIKEFFYDNDTVAVNSLGLLNALQETADHHSDFRFENFRRLTVTLTTHDPRWGLSEKDFVMAEVLTKILMQK